MKTWQKVGIGIAVLAVAGGIVWYSVTQANKDVVTVQTTHASKEHLVSIVTASGEVRPRTYSNVLAEGFGRITGIRVKEGDHVKRGDILMDVDRVQPAADVDAQAALEDSMKASLDSAEAAYRQAQADLRTQQANLEKAKSDNDRGVLLIKNGIIPAQQYDLYKSTYDAAVSSVASATAHLAQTKAQVAQAQSVLGQSKATLVHLRDVLNKTTYPRRSRA